MQTARLLLMPSHALPHHTHPAGAKGVQEGTWQEEWRSTRSTKCDCFACCARCSPTRACFSSSPAPAAAGLLAGRHPVCACWLSPTCKINPIRFFCAAGACTCSDGCWRLGLPCRQAAGALSRTRQSCTRRHAVALHLQAASLPVVQARLEVFSPYTVRIARHHVPLPPPAVLEPHAAAGVLPAATRRAACRAQARHVVPSQAGRPQPVSVQLQLPEGYFLLVAKARLTGEFACHCNEA